MNLESDIHLIDPAHGTTDDHLLCLTDDEKHRATSYRFPEDGVRWIAFRAGLRKILGETIGVLPHKVPITITPLGKPILDAPYDFLNFSLSHCNELALVALCSHGPVGIDLEPISRAPDLLGCESTFCHPAEIDELPGQPGDRAIRLLEIWTAKEALLKALGTGFTHPPETLRIRFNQSILSITSEASLPGIETQILSRLCHPLLKAYCVTLSRSSASGHSCFANER
ncbi:MAG: 4'-phosphopantetheinyl transferase superfamily protein [Gloeobacteraceae cyanobacterium ES-bin-144]|nr:4'-phosphopantetheinyl transferase superfamily protein [Verrucomicrobiales bacterium]